MGPPDLHNTAHTMENPGELLLVCARAHHEAELAGRAHDLRDWDALIDSAEFHGLAPLVYWAVGIRSRPPDTMAPAILHRLSAAYIESAKRGLFLTTSLADL